MHMCMIERIRNGLSLMITKLLKKKRGKYSKRALVAMEQTLAPMGSYMSTKIQRLNK
jgi:hypothetical protein